MSGDILREVEQLLYMEADFLDRQQWDLWLDLYAEDCVFWVPSWDTEEELTTDPEVEVNMMYLTGKPALEARLVRVRSRDAYAATPIPKTTHLVGNVRIISHDSIAIQVSAKWTALTLEPRRGKSWRGGWYDYILVSRRGRLFIQTKKITLLEGMIDGAVDFYQI